MGAAGSAEAEGADGHLEAALVDDETKIGWVIGNRVRDRRQELGFTVGELSRRAGMSKAMISKVENAQVSPSLSMLARLGRSLSVPVTAFFRGLDESRDAIFVPANQGVRLSRGQSDADRYELLGGLRGVDTHIEPVLVELNERSEVLPLFQHEGTEFIYMLSGRMEYSYGDRRYELGPGDALHLEGEVTHGPSRLREVPVRFLVVKALPAPSVRADHRH